MSQIQLKVTHAMAAPPRYQCLLENSGGIWLFSVSLSCCGSTWLEQPQPVAIQLLLKDSSCDPPPPTQRSLCLGPGEPQFHLTPWCGISSKQVEKKGDLVGVGRWCTLGGCVGPTTLEQESGCKTGGWFRFVCPSHKWSRCSVLGSTAALSDDLT